jgi:membrane protease YdiL (CAAX protease family)
VALNRIKLDNGWLRTAIVAPWPEIIVVLLIFDGYPCYISTWLASRGSHGIYSNLLLSNSSLLVNLAYESAALALMLIFLYWRGWISSDFRIKPSYWSSFQGIFLMISALIGSIAIAFMVSRSGYIRPGREQITIGHSATAHTASPAWLVLIAATIVNVYLEELIYIGYAFNQFASKSGPRFALLLTVIIRLLCHTYQGLTHVLALAAVFLIFEIYYMFSRNLWPIILAHICLDMIVFSVLKLIKEGIL